MKAGPHLCEVGVNDVGILSSLDENFWWKCFHSEWDAHERLHFAKDCLFQANTNLYPFIKTIWVMSRMDRLF